jgi:hypothetical protein
MPRQHGGDAGIRKDTQGYARIRKDTQGYARIRKDTQGYTRIRKDTRRGRCRHGAITTPGDSKREGAAQMKERAVQRAVGRGMVRSRATAHRGNLASAGSHGQHGDQIPAAAVHRKKARGFTAQQHGHVLPHQLVQLGWGHEVRQAQRHHAQCLRREWVDEWGGVGETRTRAHVRTHANAHNTSTDAHKDMTGMHEERNRAP